MLAIHLRIVFFLLSLGKIKLYMPKKNILGQNRRAGQSLTEFISVLHRHNQPSVRMTKKKCKSLGCLSLSFLFRCAKAKFVFIDYFSFMASLSLFSSLVLEFTIYLYWITWLCPRVSYLFPYHPFLLNMICSYNSLFIFCTNQCVIYPHHCVFYLLIIFLVEDCSQIGVFWTLLHVWLAFFLYF